MKRLTGADATYLYLQSPTSHMEIGGVVILDPANVEGGFSFARAREVIESRLHLVPPFRRRLVRVPFELDTPRWIEDPDFDLDYHLHHVALPVGAGRAGLDDLVGYIMSRPVDPSRPLWELHLVEGLDEGRVAIVYKTHHAALDGVGGTDLLVGLVDFTPDAGPPDPPAEAWQPDEVPGSVGLVTDSLSSLVRQPGRSVRASGGFAKALITNQMARFVPTASTPAFDSPATSFNATISANRRIHLLALPFEDLRKVKNASGTSLNDALLAVVAGALRGYLDKRGDLPESSLVAFVPQSTREDGVAHEGGNELTVLFSTLATDVDDPLARLKLISDSMAAAKSNEHQEGFNALVDLTTLAGSTGAAALGRLISRFRINQMLRASANVVVSNIPGPPIPLYVAGASVEEIYPIGPVQDGSALNITAMSYGDQMHVGLAADRDAVPDLVEIGERLVSSLAELVDLTTG